MADKKENKKAKKKHYTAEYVNDLQREIEELKGQLDLKTDILEKTDKKNSILFEKNKQLEKEKLQREKECVTRERIGKEWESLYNNEWTTAYEELCTRDKEEKCHKEQEKHLMAITEWCHNTCSDLANSQLGKIEPLLSEISSYLNWQKLDQTEASHNTEDVTGTLDNLVDHILHRRHHDKHLINRLKEKCINDYKTEHNEPLQSELTFVGKCCELCWMMCTCEPPMAIEYKNLEGEVLDKSRFNQYNPVGNRIELVVWPVLRLQENGPVIMKGIARTCSGDYDYPQYVKMSDSPNQTHVFKHINHHEIVPNSITHATTEVTDNGGDGLYITMEFRTKNGRVNPFDRRPTTHYIREPKTPPFQNLSKSDGLKSSNDLLQAPKARDKAHGKKIQCPKDETFVSYLTTNSSTL